MSLQLLWLWSAYCWKNVFATVVVVADDVLTTRDGMSFTNRTKCTDNALIMH